MRTLDKKRGAKMTSGLWNEHKDIATHEIATENVLNGSEAAALENNLECLSPTELEMLESFDKQIDSEFRKMDIIEQMEEKDSAWKDGLDHQMQVLEIKSLRDTMAEYAMEHSDNPILSDLIMQKVEYVDSTLDNRLNVRAKSLIKETDELIADVKRTLRTTSI